MSSTLRRNLRFLLFAIFIFMAGPVITQAQTTLVAGDVMIVGWNATLNTTNGTASSDNNFDFVLLKDIVSGTDIFFTDFGWTGSGFQQNVNNGCAAGNGAITDGCIKWTASSNMTAGTQVRVDCRISLTASSGTVTPVVASATAGSYMMLGTNTDQIFAFQGSLSTPTLIAAVQYGGGSWAGATTCQNSSTASSDPGSSVGGFGMLYTGISDNNHYNGTVTAGSPAALRTAILVANSWNAAATAFTFPLSTDFIVGVEWQGTTSNWFTTTNWSCTCTPSSTSNVIIPNGASAYPNISSGTATVKNIQIASSASVSVTSSGVLQIAGNITNNGTFSASAGGITLNGSSAQTLSGSAFNGGTANTIEDLVISNTAGVSISSALNIAATGSLTVGSGSTLTTGGNLTLVSSSAGTARVAESAGTVSGNVTVQRYIPNGRRAWRFLSNPLTTTQPLSVLQDDIDITGWGAGTNGFVWTQNNAASAYWYDQSVGNGSTSNDPGWTPFTSTNGAGANGWQKGKGLRVLIRGAKGEGLNNQVYTPSAVTLDVTGVINQGSQVINITKGSGNSYYFTGNPFPSQINMSLVAKGGGIGSSYWTWDPNQATKGAFINRSYSTTYHLPSMAGFITHVLSSSTLTFPESCKSTGTPGVIFKTTAATDLIDLQLYSDSIHWDGLQVYLNANSTADSEWNDGPKMANPEIDFYTLSADGHKLSIDTRPYSKGSAIALGLKKAALGVYTIKAGDFLMPEGTRVYLHDKRTNRKEQITEGFAYSFTIADSLDQGEGRFELVFEGDPVTGIANMVANGIKVSIIPNPASDKMNISYELPSTQDVAVVVTDMNGAIVYQGNAGNNSKGNVTIDVQRWAQGIYLVKLTAGNESTTQRFIKK